MDDRHKRHSLDGATISFVRNHKLVEREISGAALFALDLLMHGDSKGMDRHQLPDPADLKSFQRGISRLRKLGLLISTRLVSRGTTWFGRYRLHQMVSFVSRDDGRSIHSDFLPTRPRTNDFFGGLPYGLETV